MKEKTVCPVFCDTCGGPLDYDSDGVHARCPYCGNEYNFGGGRSYALSLALSRANAMRLSCDFSGAALEYKLIASRDAGCAEAWWGLALCDYGTEYVPLSSGGVTPTFRKLRKTGILADENYNKAINCAEQTRAQSYKTKAEEIERVLSETVARVQWGRRCDVFLCCRNGGEEQNVARRLYEELTRRGLSVFCPEYSLKGLSERDYEPEVFSALYSCGYFILISCGNGAADGAFVKNWWMRFRERLFEERLTDACCALYSGDVNGLPAFIRGNAIPLSRYPQGGYEIEIADNILAISGRQSQKEPSVSDNFEQLDKELEEGRAALDGGRFVQSAAAYSRAIALDGDCGEAWLGALLSELEVKKIGTEKKFSQEICNKLWASGRTVAECDARLAENEHIVYAFSSPYYKNAVKYSTAATARILSQTRLAVCDMADKCNAALKLSRRECAERASSRPRSEGAYRQTGSASGTTYARAPRSNSSVQAIAGAVAGGIAGLMLGRRFARREPRMFRFRPPRRRR